MVQGLYHAVLGANDATWSKPARLGGDDAKNADLAMGADGSLLAVWDEPGARGSPLRLARSTDGRQWAPPETIAARAEATHPRVVATAKGAVTLWFEGSPWNGARLFANGREIPSAL